MRVASTPRVLSGGDPLWRIVTEEWVSKVEGIALRYFALAWPSTFSTASRKALTSSSKAVSSARPANRQMARARRPRLLRLVDNQGRNFRSEKCGHMKGVSEKMEAAVDSNPLRPALQADASTTSAPRPQKILYPESTPKSAPKLPSYRLFTPLLPFLTSGWIQPLPKLHYGRRRIISAKDHGLALRHA